VLIVGFVGVYLYYVNMEKPKEELPPVVTINNDSVVGCYVAKLAKDVYLLKIDSEVNGNVVGALAFNNFEKDSSSGTFNGTYKDGILLGNYSFSSEGMDSEMQVIFKKEEGAFVRGYGNTKIEGDKVTFENLADITYDSSAKFTKNPTCMETFTEANNKFTLSYNTLFKAYEPNPEQNVPNLEWRLDAKQKGMLLARVSIPKVYMPNTNFSNAYLTVGASTVPKEITSCTNPGSGEVKEGMKDISGYPFTRFAKNGAAAGNLYETVSYRGLLDGDCYALEYTIHSTNIANYSPDQNIKEFDKAKVQNEFEKIIASFKFLVNSD